MNTSSTLGPRIDRLTQFMIGLVISIRFQRPVVDVHRVLLGIDLELGDR